jgi:hypothetical protein
MNKQLPRHRRLPLAAGAVILWIAVSPWVWGFAGSRSAVADHVFIVLSFGPMSAMIAALRPAALVTLAGAIWLVLSPWILGYAIPHAAWVDETVTGALLAVLSASATGIGLGPRRRRQERDDALVSLESVA